ncbi:DUF6934 family protein [Mucilaginibacter ginsenosidivorax]|uniref:Uncharacterized protein n=1 Tax=Mucilaginibacter ginsenosidivorax TaxID=862126 RepID=A0A5B8W3V5_9SPHI|nr:hypothetical protein [Mucilaginibacter ginsenosidivorax]QEC78481.1 hypothetical protein FSB76_21955 [Mucilaginibacter ginsenosidivorax]
MNLKHYSYLNSNDYHDYEFYSEGPKGRIRKLISFTKIPNQEPPVYNLAFGDSHPDTGELDDSVVSNNEDRDTVLATVANAIIDFSQHNGNHYIYAEGSTASRTRLYQISITNLWLHISMDFEVYGLKNNEWCEFIPNSINYETFLVRKK